MQMRKNPHVQPAKATGTPTMGNGKPFANMPANNVGEHTVKLGAGKPSTFGHNVKPGVGQAKTGTVNNVGANLNSTNYINTGNKAKLGSTNHGVGEVPAYLRNPQNPDTHNITN